MYNKKSRVSAILALVTAALFVGLLLVFAFSGMNLEGNIGAALLIFILGGYGLALFYAGSILAAVITFFCGLAMLLGKTQRRLIFANRSLMILCIILLPFVALGMLYVGYLYYMVVDGLPRFIFTVVTGIAYLGCIVVSIVTLISLKRMPDYPAPADEAKGETEE